MNSIERLFAKYYMGRWPKLLNLDFALKTIAVCALVGLGAPVLINTISNSAYGADLLSRATTNWLQAIVGVSLAFGAIWVIGLVLFNWTKEFDVLLTYLFRTDAFIFAVGTWFVLAAIWGVIAYVLALGIDQAIKASSGLGYPFAFTCILVAGLPAAVFVPLYMRRGIHNIALDQRYVEGISRIALAAAFGVMVVLWAILLA